MEDERGTFRPVMARKGREREDKESSGYLTGSMGHGGGFLATCDSLSALSSSRGSAQRQSQKAKARARVNQANRGSWPSTFTSRP